MKPRAPFPSSLRRALDRINRLIDGTPHVTPALDDHDALLALYLRHCRDELLYSPQSLRQQFYNMRYVLRWHRNRARAFPATTSTEDILAFLAFQRDERGNSLIQQRHYLGSLRRFFALLVRRGLLDADPTGGLALKTPRIRNVHQVLTLPELHALLAAARHDRDTAPPRVRLARTRGAAFVSLLACTGCRLAEALGLVRVRIDIDARVAFFPGKGDYRYSVKERVVPLADDAAIDDLRRWLACLDTAPDTPVFVTPSGRTLEPRAALNRIRRVADLAGIQRRVTAHSLRATFASRLVDNGIDPVALCQLMGHAHLSTTLTLYAKLDVASLQDTWRRTNPLAPLPGHLDANKD